MQVFYKMNKEKDIAEWMLKHPMKITKFITTMLQNMDGRCRQMAMSTPNRPMSDYCQRCQVMINKLWEDFK